MNMDRTSLTALADARRSTRCALAALRSMSFTTTSRDDRVLVSQVAAALADAVAELERIEQRARLAL